MCQKLETAIASLKFQHQPRQEFLYIGLKFVVRTKMSIAQKLISIFHFITDRFIKSWEIAVRMRPSLNASTIT